MKQIMKNAGIILAVVTIFFTLVLCIAGLVRQCRPAPQIDEPGMNVEYDHEERQNAELKNGQINNQGNVGVSTEEKVREEDPYSSGFNTEGNASYQKLVGKYEFKDEINNTWVLTIFEDETAQIVNKKKENTVCYGSCNDFLSSLGFLCMSFMDEYPIIFFPSGEEMGMQLCITGKADYIYDGISATKAKNPRKRLPLKRTK